VTDPEKPVRLATRDNAVSPEPFAEGNRRIYPDGDDSSVFGRKIGPRAPGLAGVRRGPAAAPAEPAAGFWSSNPERDQKMEPKPPGVDLKAETERVRTMLRRLAARAGFTQTEVAERVGLTQGSLTLSTMSGASLRSRQGNRFFRGAIPWLDRPVSALIP